MIALDLVKSSWRVYRADGLAKLVSEVLKYLTFYGTPDKVFKYWFNRLIGKRWIMRDVQGSDMWLNYKFKRIHTDLIQNGIREREATRYIQTILQPDWVVVDIGANIGYYALMEAKVCKKVIAIEPEPDNFALLLKNITQNGYKNVEPARYAVGDTNGEIELALSEAANWHRVATKNAEKNAITVPITTLDDFLGDEKVDLVRMDVEGYEWNILQGMKKTIENNPHLSLFIELHGEYLKEYGSSAKQVLEFLNGYGFVVTNSTIITVEKPIAPLDKALIARIAKGCIADHLFFART